MFNREVMLKAIKYNFEKIKLLIFTNLPVWNFSRQIKTKVQFRKFSDPSFNKAIWIFRRIQVCGALYWGKPCNFHATDKTWNAEKRHENHQHYLDTHAEHWAWQRNFMSKINEISKNFWLVSIFDAFKSFLILNGFKSHRLTLIMCSNHQKYSSKHSCCVWQFINVIVIQIKESYANSVIPWWPKGDNRRIRDRKVWNFKVSCSNTALEQFSSLTPKKIQQIFHENISRCSFDDFAIWHVRVIHDRHKLINLHFMFNSSVNLI